MPTYDYRCNACDHRFEVFQSMKDGPKRTCPSCGKKTLERLIGSGAAVLFKGSGFYQTDYRSEGYKKSAAADGSPPTSGETKPGASPAPAVSEPKLTSKPATRPESKKAKSKGD